jgi:hypothetical protein
MFAGGIRLSGLKILSKYKIREGIPLCLEIIDLTKWGKRNRLDGCIRAIENYGPAAKPLLPGLKKLEQELRDHREAKGLVKYTEQIQKIIAYLESTDNKIELRSIK